MFSCDFYLIEFFKANYLTVGLAFVILNGLAKVSSWEWDEKILAVIREGVSSFLPIKSK